MRGHIVLFSGIPHMMSYMYVWNEYWTGTIFFAHAVEMMMHGGK